MSDHTCPDCGATLSADTATVVDTTGGTELTATDAVAMLAQSGSQMQNLVLQCNECDWSVARTVTIRSNE